MVITAYLIYWWVLQSVHLRREHICTVSNYLPPRYLLTTGEIIVTLQWKCPAEIILTRWSRSISPVIRCTEIRNPVILVHCWKKWHHFCGSPFFFSNKLFYLFIFDCVGSSLLHTGFSLVAGSGGYSLLRCMDFSLWWLLLLRTTGSRRAGFSSCSTWVSVVVAHGL